MALFVDGMPCGLCGDPMDVMDHEEIECFAPVTANRRDPTWELSDGCFHQACLRPDLPGAETRQRAAEFQDRLRTWPPNCVHCGEHITRPDDFFGLPYLVSSPDHPLYPFNCSYLHIGCLPFWSALDRVHALLTQLLDSGSWDPDALSVYPELIESALATRREAEPGPCGGDPPRV